VRAFRRGPLLPFRIMEISRHTRKRPVALPANGILIVVLLVSHPSIRSGRLTQTASASRALRHTYTTNFPLTEDPISEGGKWASGRKDGLDWANVRTTSGFAFGTEPGGRRPAPQEYDDSTALLTGSWGPNQTAQATVHARNPDVKINEEVELRLRSNLSPHRATGYEILFRAYQGADAYCEIVRWNGPLGDFTYIGRAKGPRCNVANGSVVKATAAGNVITAYINGVQVVQARDDTYTTGNPGIGFFLYGSTGANPNGDFGFTSFTASDQ